MFDTKRYYQVVKMDKTFNLDEFGTTLRFEIVPHVLEAYLRKDMVILKDWSHERVGWGVVNPI